jgi:hypothetical protein
VWLFPATYALHLGEEYAVAGGFTVWAERTLGIRFSQFDFVAWNAFALALVCVGAWLVSRDSKFRFIEIALSIAVLGNVLTHLIGTVLTRTYSPGLATGILIWVPLGTVRLRQAVRASGHRARIAGCCIGIGVVLVTLLVVSLRTLFAR